MVGEPAPPGVYSVSAPAEPDGLEHLHRLIDQARGDWPSIDPSHFDMLEMAIIELAGNVARHGRTSGATEVALRVAVDHHEVAATLRDAGRRFEVDIEGAELPDELDEAGRGVAMARLAVDELTYDHRDGVNTWHMRRRTDA